MELIIGKPTHRRDENGWEHHLVEVTAKGFYGGTVTLPFRSGMALLATPHDDRIKADMWRNYTAVEDYAEGPNLESVLVYLHDEMGCEGDIRGTVETAKKMLEVYAFVANLSPLERHDLEQAYNEYY